MRIPIVVIGITFSSWLEELPMPAMMPVLVMAESSDDDDCCGHKLTSSRVFLESTFSSGAAAGVHPTIPPFRSVIATGSR